MNGRNQDGVWRGKRRCAMKRNQKKKKKPTCGFNECRSMYLLLQESFGNIKSANSLLCKQPKEELLSDAGCLPSHNAHVAVCNKRK